jgi:hypothetical protein
MDIYHDDCIRCRVVVPVDKMELHVDLDMGKFKIWRPVDGGEVLVGTHPVGAYYVGESASRDFHDAAIANDGPQRALISMLSYPLIDFEMDVPKALLLSDSPGSVARLVAFVADEADRALDVLRFYFCHYKRPHYLPNRAGQLSEGHAEAHIDPLETQFKPRHAGALAYVLQTMNTWLGLEVDFHPAVDSRLLAIADGTDDSAVGGRVRAALKMLNDAFYITTPDAAFLQMIFATEALCQYDDNGDKAMQVAAAKGGDDATKRKTQDEFRELYRLRNKLVHAGKTLRHLQQDEAERLQSAFRILGAAIEKIGESTCTTSKDFKIWMADRMPRDA